MLNLIFKLGWFIRNNKFIMLCDYHVIFFLNCNFILKKTKSNIAVLNLEVMKPNKKKEFN